MLIYARVALCASDGSRTRDTRRDRAVRTASPLPKQFLKLASPGGDDPPLRSWEDRDLTNVIYGDEMVGLENFEIST